MNNFDSNCNDLETSLRELIPIGGRESREQIMFRVGQASAKLDISLWQSLSGALSIVVMVLLFVLVMDHPRDARMASEKDSQKNTGVEIVGNERIDVNSQFDAQLSMLALRHQLLANNSNALQPNTTSETDTTSKPMNIESNPTMMRKILQQLNES